MKTDEESAYQSYGVNCSEVEVDVLSGEVEIVRSDILFDCGQRLDIHRTNICCIDSILGKVCYYL